MNIPTHNEQINQKLQKFFLISHTQPSVSFDLIYPYTYLFITDIVLSTIKGSMRHTADLLLDYYLRIILKKTDGERRSFSVNFIKYIETMHVSDQPGKLIFTLNLPIAGENIQSKAINSQNPYYNCVEITLEHMATANLGKPIELTVYYHNCEGLELNKL